MYVHFLVLALWLLPLGVSPLKAMQADEKCECVSQGDGALNSLSMRVAQVFRSPAVVAKVKELPVTSTMSASD